MVTCDLGELCSKFQGRYSRPVCQIVISGLGKVLNLLGFYGETVWANLGLNPSIQHV